MYHFTYLPPYAQASTYRVTRSGRSVAPRSLPKRQRGASMIEFYAVALPMLLLGVLIVEVAQWQLVRQVAYVALLDSARAAATQQVRREVVEHRTLALPLHS